MARIHKRLGVAGVVVGGTIRDLAGIRQVGLPVWAWGTVPGHGIFHVTRFNTPVSVGQLRIHPGDLLLADADGCVRIPPDHAEEILRLAGEVRAAEAKIFDFYKPSRMMELNLSVACSNRTIFYGWKRSAL